MSTTNLVATAASSPRRSRQGRRSGRRNRKGTGARPRSGRFKWADPPPARPRPAIWRPRAGRPSFTAIPDHRAATIASHPVLPPVRRAFRALAVTVLPEAEGLDERGWAELERIVEDNLASRPPAMRRQIRLLVRALQFLPFIRYGRPFTALDAARRDRFLRALGDGPLLLLRRGVWGVRVLVQMGYYGQPAHAAAIGYRAEARGWEARR